MMNLKNDINYRHWREIKRRCCKKSHKDYALYGGRGIKLCERWHNFHNFMMDMGPRPEGMSIDRINNNGDYEPGNCRWADNRTQARNTRRVKIDFSKAVSIAIDTIMLNGTPKSRAKRSTINSIAESQGVSYSTVLNIKYGNTWADALDKARCIVAMFRKATPGAS